MQYILLLLTILIATLPAVAQPQSNSALTAEDYAHAERFLSGTTDSLIYRADVRPKWLSGDNLVYRNTIPEGFEYVLIDPSARTRARAFDHMRLSKAISIVADTTYDSFHLPFTQFDFSDDGRSISFAVQGQQYKCDIDNYNCTVGQSNDMESNTVISPDKQYAAFIRNYNLWMRDLSTDSEIQLTTDGIEDFGYATNNAGWIRSDRPVLLWSPDSKKIATFQQDARGVGEMSQISTKVGHPELVTWKYPMPADSVIFRMHRVIIHLDGPRVVRLQILPDPQRSSITDEVVGVDGEWLDVEWSADSSKLAFLSISRDYKQAILRVVDDVVSGQVRDVMEETVETFFESGFGKVNWHVLQESNEVIWFSQRDNWGHLYLYDLQAGELKNRITSGDWNVLQLLRIDRENRTLYFTGSGRETGNPYFHYLYSVRMDGTDFKLLTPENANHSISLSPSGCYFVDSYSTPVIPPITILRDANGQKLLTLEEADISSLLALEWKPPTPIKVKGRDGLTDIYGLMYKPTSFDPSKSYPILNNVYPGPHTGSVGSRSFRPSRLYKQAFAELGFIVVEVDAMGTPGRSKSFHAANYGNMGDNGIPDQIAAIKELAGLYKWMDLKRVGIWGHSAGGTASVSAILRYPDFYKVAVSSAGNHDNRNYEDAWGEKWQGLLKNYPDSTSNYDNQANQLLAGNLKGKLLIAHGTMDSNVPPSNTLLLVDALIAANKDFDLLMLPNRGHGFGSEPYMIRQRWDYFVRYLLGVEPPKEYKFKSVR
ncbi:DPP IV N-terminal domain-containing protein [Candidatus Latescibacterota bacterium]